MAPDASTRRTDPAQPNPASPPAEPRWQVRLLGAVEVFDGVQCLHRFASRAVAALLARLALAPDRAHARAKLVEMLWPGVPGVVVVLADRLSLRAAPGALGCDALHFQQLVRAGQGEQAATLYRGELMPGYFDEWIHDERQRLAALHERPSPAASARCRHGRAAFVAESDHVFGDEGRAGAGAGHRHTGRVERAHGLGDSCAAEQVDRRRWLHRVKKTPLAQCRRSIRPGSSQSRRMSKCPNLAPSRFCSPAWVVVGFVARRRG